VVEFLATEDEDALFPSIVTLAELRRGVDRLATGRRRSRRDDWLRNDLPARFTGRLMGIDAPTADARGRLIARRERVGQPMGAMDGWIAATAEVHGLTLVTRDVAGLAGTAGEVVCPWTAD
jgi:toxin FitB